MNSDQQRFSGTVRPEKPDRLLFIDGLRGCAALAVVIFHLYYVHTSAIHPTLARLPQTIQWVLGHGDLGVDVFFVLSGFVIARSVRGDRITPRFVGNFALRRSLRLDPPYWLMIFIIVAIKGGLTRANPGETLFSSRGFKLGDVLANMAYIHPLVPKSKTIVSVSWTLCLEVMFYLSYVLLLALAQQLTPRAKARQSSQPSQAAILGVFGPVLVGSLICFNFLALGHWGGNGNGWHMYLGRGQMFLLGALLQWVIDGWVAVPWFAAACGAALMMNGSALLGKGIADLHSLVTVATAVSIFICARRNCWGKWLSGPTIQMAGRLSYSIYLVHVPVCTVILAATVRMLGQTPLAAAVGVAMSVVAVFATGYVMNRLVEAPSMNLSRRFRRQRVSAGVPQEAQPRPNVNDLKLAMGEV